MQFVWAIALIVASYAITALSTRRPQQSQPSPAEIGDFNFPQSAEGTPQPIVFGDCWMSDWMVLWYGNYKAEPVYGGSSSKK